MKLSKTGKMKIYELDLEECELLLSEAELAMNNTYPSPNSGYAAAVMTDSGKIFSGGSYSSNTETLTMHGEAVALAHAASNGEKNIVAITGPNCHICKQLIYESSLNSGIEIVVVIKEDEVIKQIPISELMPCPWP